MRIFVTVKNESYYIAIGSCVYLYNMDTHKMHYLYTTTVNDLADYPQFYTDVTPYIVELFIPSIDEYIQSEVFGELDEDGCMDFMAARAKQNNYHRLER